MEEFRYAELAPGIIQISDSTNACSTLVCGEEKAILFDTMMGLGDLKAYIKQFTEFPLIVINSHGHFDHMGGNYQFDEVYLSKKDWDLIPVNYECTYGAEGTTGKDLSHARESLRDISYLKDIQPDTIFELGGLTCRIIALPGHTGGSIGILIEERRILLGADAISPQMCMFMDGKQPLQVYKDMLNSLDDLEFDTFALGHYMRLFPKRLIEKNKECAELVGKKRGINYVYSLVPSYEGRVYLLEHRNPDVEDGVICLILKDEENQ